jgi:acetoin:2,6-dichlorophenolindophenol oxidoreductase subunit beta
MSGTANLINTPRAVNMALDEAMSLDSRVIVLGEDIADPQGGGVVGATKGLSTKYPGRVRSTPISEQAIIGAAIGASLAGLRPVAEIMLMNHAAKLRFMSGGQTHVPITIRTLTGVGIGVGAQHSDMLEAWFAHTAGIKVVAPSSPAEAKGLLLSCIFDDDPCIFIENTPTLGVTETAPEPGLRIPLGKANIVRSGKDVTVISYARQVRDALAVAKRLDGEGVSVEVIDLRTISPWDAKTVLASVARTGRAVIVHEAARNFGVGAEISARINEELFGQLKAPLQRLGGRNSPVPFSKPLESAFAPNQGQIESAIRTVLR